MNINFVRSFWWEFIYSMSVNYSCNTYYLLVVAMGMRGGEVVVGAQVFFYCALFFVSWSQVLVPLPFQPHLLARTSPSSVAGQISSFYSLNPQQNNWNSYRIKKNKVESWEEVKARWRGLITERHREQTDWLRTDSK